MIINQTGGGAGGIDWKKVTVPGDSSHTVKGTISGSSGTIYGHQIGSLSGKVDTLYSAEVNSPLGGTEMLVTGRYDREILNATTSTTKSNQSKKDGEKIIHDLIDACTNLPSNIRFECMVGFRYNQWYQLTWTPDVIHCELRDGVLKTDLPEIFARPSDYSHGYYFAKLVITSVL